MDLEKLTKHQIVLLTLLVSFVTSIATGIVTVSLMDQAPEGVTRVVNQIVERTIETVVPQTAGEAAVGNATEHTVVVKDDDLAAESIAQVQKGIIRIVARGSDTLVARGIITEEGGLALTDGAALTASGAEAFDAILASGERVPLTVLSSVSGTSSLVSVSLAFGTSTGFAPAVLAEVGNMVLGQSVIWIGGTYFDTVGTGVIATIPSSSTGDTPHEVMASVASAIPGSVITTLFGEVVGIATTNTISRGGNFYEVPLSAP
jgi:hypothetical protein